MNPMLESHESK